MPSRAASQLMHISLGGLLLASPVLSGCGRLLFDPQLVEEDSGADLDAFLSDSSEDSRMDGAVDSALGDTADDHSAADGSGSDSDTNDTSSDAGDGCDPSFVEVSGQTSRYRRESTLPATWDGAKATCEAFGAGHQLVVLSDDTERESLMGQLSTVTSAYWWLNGEDRTTEGVWIDAAGAALSYLPWGLREPNNTDNEDCLALISDLAQPVSRVWRLNDLQCDREEFFICECVL